MSGAVHASWLFIWLFTIVFSSHAFATVTVNSVAGAISGSVVTSSEVTLIQSAQGTNCGGTVGDSETCDNCSGNPVGNFCSTRYAASTKYFYLNFTSTAAGTLTVTRSSDDAALPLNGSTTSVAANAVQQVKLRWSDIESMIWTATNHTGVIKLKVDANFVSITVKRLSTSGSNDSDCTTSSQGACDFRTFPGDEKVYLELDIDTGFPTNSTGGIDFAGVRVFYKEIPQSDVANCPNRDTTAACALTLNYGEGEYLDRDIDTSRSFEDTMSGLQNDKYYCFWVVNRTQSGDLGWGVDIDSTTTRKCVSGAPSEVVGLLTETNNCFIATAAYGSPLRTKVKTLREFRDRILLPTSWGKEFVKWYYKHSPFWAKKIEKNETAKFAVRIILWPIWLMSWLILKFSFATLFVLLVPLFFYMFRKHKRTTVSIILLASLGSLPAMAQDLEEEEDVPPQEAPFTPSTEEAPQAQTPPQTEQRIEALKKNIATEQAQLQKDNEKIEKLETELNKLTDESRRRRMNIGSKTQKILDLESRERMERNPPRMSKRTGEIQYLRKESPQNYGGSFRVGNYSPTELTNSSNNVSFDEVYKDSADIIVLLDFEWQFFKGLGKAGLKFGSGIFTATGKGRFKNSPQTEARENFTFLMMPNVVGGVYRLQIWDKQVIVPFVEGGGGYFTFIEVRDDFKRTKYGGSAVGYWAAGGQLLLDFLSPATMGELDSDYGINHMWLTAEYRSYIGGGDLDFSANSFNAGIFFEF